MTPGGPWRSVISLAVHFLPVLAPSDGGAFRPLLQAFHYGRAGVVFSVESWLKDGFGNFLTCLGRRLPHGANARVIAAVDLLTLAAALNRAKEEEVEAIEA